MFPCTNFSDIWRYVYTSYAVPILCCFFPKFNQVGAITGLICYNMANLFTKVSLAVFYLRLSPSRMFNSIVYTTTAVVIIYSIISAFSFSFLCDPVQKYWDFLTPGSCIDMNAFGVAMATINSATDFTLLLLPICIIWPLQSLSVWKRISLAAILMAGSL